MKRLISLILAGMSGGLIVLGGILILKGDLFLNSKHSNVHFTSSAPTYVGKELPDEMHV